MASYTAVGAAQNPSMTVSFKMDITTYGPHNGIFITSGIQQGVNNIPFQGFVAASQTQGNAIIGTTSVPAITGPGFGGSTLSIPGSQTGRTTFKPESDRLDINARSRSNSRSRPTTPAQNFGRDSPPDEFIAPEKFELNTFSQEPFIQHPTDYVLNDTKTTTTTVEVFRAKVDKNDPVDFFELPPDPLGPDYRPQLVRAVGPPYEVSTKTETRFADQPVIQPSPGSRIQWSSSQERIGSRASSRQGRLEAPTSNYSGSLERNRSSGGLALSREPLVDADYQATILRRQFNQHEDQRIQRSRATSPSPSAGRVYSIPIERDYERGPRALRQTTSQPDVFDTRRTRRRQSPEAGYPSRSREPSPVNYPLRRARSRSETRSDDYPEGRPLSRAESWENSVNNIFKLYQTRDCLGNVIQEFQLEKDKSSKSIENERKVEMSLPAELATTPLNSSLESIIVDTSPRKERGKYDKEMVETEIAPILKAERQPKSDDGRRSRVEFLNSEDGKEFTSRTDPFENQELKAEAPLCLEEDFDTPRSVLSPTRKFWVEKVKKIDYLPETRGSEGKFGKEAAAMEQKFIGPVCLEIKDSMDFVPEKKSEKFEPIYSELTESSGYLIPRKIPKEKFKYDENWPGIGKEFSKVTETLAENKETWIPTTSKSSEYPQPVESFVYRMPVSAEATKSKDNVPSTSHWHLSKTTVEIPVKRSSSLERPLCLIPPVVLPENKIQEAMIDPVEKLKLSDVSTAQLSRSGWLRRKQKLPENDDLPLPPMNIPISLLPQPSTSFQKTTDFAFSTPIKSFSQQLKEQFSHSPSSSVSSSFGVTSPAPESTSSPLLTKMPSDKPPLPPNARQSKLSLTKLDSELRIIKPVPKLNLTASTNVPQPSLEMDSTWTDDSEPSVNFETNYVVDPKIKVIAEDSKLHIFGI